MPPSDTKYIPSLAQIQEAAADLPDPKNYVKDTFEASIGKGKTITFERIKFKKSEGNTSSKWTYKGRAIIDSKFLKLK